MKQHCLRLFFFLLLPALSHSQTANDEMVNVKEIIPDIAIDLKYNTADNFLHQKMYSTDECLLAMGTVKQLKLVQDSLRVLGLGLKIFDGYRPRAVQYLMYEIFPNPVYVADPASGSNHNRGGAVDLTLITLTTGQELRMPTAFDYFGVEASHGWTIGMTQEQINNRVFLLTIMETVGGFTRYDAEWWHYQYSPSLANPLLDFQMK
jgi:D-alanyl-D-alanine dipeptidase